MGAQGRPQLIASQEHSFTQLKEEKRKTAFPSFEER